jgi:hypothetical protein
MKDDLKPPPAPAEAAALTVPTDSPELVALRAELTAARREAAITGFLAEVGREFPTANTEDLRSLVASRLQFRDGVLTGTQSAIDYLRSRSFLQQSQQATTPTSAVERAQIKRDLDARVREIFGPTSSGTAANALFRSDPAAYNQLKVEAIRMGLLSDPKRPMTRIVFGGRNSSS